MTLSIQRAFLQPCSIFLISKPPAMKGHLSCTNTFSDNIGRGGGGGNVDGGEWRYFYFISSPVKSWFL